jgi:hypothetical protein
MPLSLGPYCAYWFLQKQLGSPDDTAPPEDGPLNVTDRKQLARHILNDVDAAVLTTGRYRVDLDVDAFLPEASGWNTHFDVVACMLTCARRKDARVTDHKASVLAFGDYIATRWIYRRVLHEHITARPADDEFFPPPYDTDAKRALAGTLAGYCSRIGVPLKDQRAFVSAASRWQLISDARAALLKQVVFMLAMLLWTSQAAAQLADAGGTADEVISVFFQKAAEDDWHGGVATRGEQDVKTRPVRLNWQVDYGSLETKRISASGLTTGKEAAVSKNSGLYTGSYVHMFGHWRIKADTGVEHRRVLNAELRRINQTHFIVNGSLRNVDAKTLWRGNIEPQASWLLQANVVTTKVLTASGETRTICFDPVAVGWLAFLPGYVTVPDRPRILFRRIQLRAELAATGPLDSDIDAEAHWDGSIVFFFTPANGIMLRRFSGFFDHNLRDRKRATTISLVWKYR